MSAAKFWDKQAAKYAKSKIGDEASYRKGLDHTVAHLTKDMSVLEFGCGTGMTAQTLARYVGQYLATDVSAAMIAECEKRQVDQRVQNLKFQQAELSDPDLGLFDAVLGFNILHLIPDIDTALKDINRLLPTGGLAITKTTCQPVKFNPFFKMMLGLAWVFGLFNSGLKVRIDPVATLDQRFIDAGFEILEVGNYPSDPPNRFIVARKL